MHLERLALAIGRMLSVGFGIIAVIVVYEVVARYGFNAPTYWVHELAGFLAAVAFIFGGAYCMAEETHMRIDYFVEGSRSWIRTVSEVTGGIAGAIYLAGLSWASWSMSESALFRFTAEGKWDPERSGSSWNSPTPAFIRFALFLGSLLFLLIVVRRLALAVMGRR